MCNHSWPWCILHSFFPSCLTSITLANYTGFLPKHIQNLTISHHPPPHLHPSPSHNYPLLEFFNLEPSDPAQTQVRSCQSAQTFWRYPIFLMVKLTESTPWYKSPTGSGPIPFLIAFLSILSFYSNLATLAFFLFFESSRLVPTGEPLQPSFYLECSIFPFAPSLSHLTYTRGIQLASFLNLFRSTQQSLLCAIFPNQPTYNVKASTQCFTFLWLVLITSVLITLYNTLKNILWCCLFSLFIVEYK